jgi:heterodisulfide reductase subunit A-like polyferredoxin
MSKTANTVGVVLACGGRFTAKERERLAARLGSSLLIEESFGSQGQAAALASRVAKRRFTRVLLAGIAPAGQAELLQTLARQAGLPASAVAGLDLGPALASRGRGQEALQAIRRGLAALEQVPAAERRSLTLEPRVLVVGAGLAGLEAASALRGLGHPVTIVERDGTGAGSKGAAPKAPRLHGALHGATLLAGSTVRRAEGQIGGFAVTVRTPSGDRRVACGAVVLASGIPAAAGSGPYEAAGVLPMDELEQAVASLPRRRGVRSVAVVLDWALDETKGSTQAALELSLKLQKEGSLQVHLFCRQVRVAAMELEELYDRARQAGVDMVKFEGRLALRAAGKAVAAGAAVAVDFRDAILGAQVSLECDLVGVSGYGVSGASEAELARLFGVSLDALGQMQPNNIHLFPGETNRPGVFAVGSCRGQFYPPRIESEARATALAVHRLLAPGVLEVELAQAMVDEDKCALCLTCVRSCPHGAMYVDRAKGAAASAPEACRRCGICVGECPARAITLPAWPDSAVMSQVS